MNALLALVFAAGVGLIWAGSVCHATGASLRESVEGHLGFVRLPRPLSALAAIAAGCCAAVAAWWLVELPALTVVAAVLGGYVPIARLRRVSERRLQERERAWPAVLRQIADALEAGLAFPAAIALAAAAGPGALRSTMAVFHSRLRNDGLAEALDGLAATGERTADTVVLFLRAGLLELPTGGLAPLLRELALMASERYDAAERARGRARSLQLEAAILALSPIVLLLLIGAASPGYLDAYRSAGGSAVIALGGVMIFGCYLLMRQLGRVPEPRRTGTGR